MYNNPYLHNQASVPQSGRLVEERSLVGLISSPAESSKDIQLSTNINLNTHLGNASVGTALSTTSRGSLAVESGLQKRSLESKSSDETLAEEGSRKLQGEGGGNLCRQGCLAAQAEAGGLDARREVGALAEGEAGAVGEAGRCADGGRGRRAEAGDGGIGDDVELGANVDDVGDGKAGEGHGSNGDAGGERRADAAAGGDADLDGGTEVARGGERGLEAVAKRQRDVGVEGALGLAVGAGNGEVDAVNGGAVDGLREVVANVDAHVLADISSSGSGSGHARDADAGVLGKVLPGSLCRGEEGRVGGGVVGDGLDGEGLAALGAGTSGVVGNVDDGVAGGLVDPFPGSLGGLQGGGAAELDGDVVAGAVDGLDDVLEVGGAEETEVLGSLESQVGLDA